MKKVFKVLTIATAVVLGLSINNFAFASTSVSFKVAVVDVQKVVDSSPQINALKTQQRNKMNALGAFVEKAKADVASQKDSAKKKSLEANYNKELNSRKAAIDKETAKKLLEIDKSVKAIIKAKSTKYDLVLIKNSVLEGGTDITNEIVKALK